jgi:hypothetical protein
MLFALFPRKRTCWHLGTSTSCSDWQCWKKRGKALAGITNLEANRFIREGFLPRYNEEFQVAAQEEGSAFVAWIGGDLADILCEHHERTVGSDNCVKFEKRILQLPMDKHRCHYVKAKVEVHRYPDGRMAVFHGPKKLADYTAEGKEVKSAEETTHKVT